VIAAWFRWYHGSVNDPKFGLVARKAGASVAEVIATWAALLEQASASDDRGNPGEPDFEAIDFALGMDDGKARRIYERMRERLLIDAETGRISAWEKRQPKREDDTAADRKRRQREREHELKMASVTGNESRNVTQCHADVTHGHDRGEERRREEKLSLPSVERADRARDTAAADSAASTATGQACRLLREAGVQRVNPSHAQLAELLSRGVTGRQLADLAVELRERKGQPPAMPYVLATMAGRLRDAAASPTQTPPARASPKPRSSTYGDEIDRISASIHGSRAAPTDIIDVEAHRVR